MWQHEQTNLEKHEAAFEGTSSCVVVRDVESEKSQLDFGTPSACQGVSASSKR